MNMIPDELNPWYHPTKLKEWLEETRSAEVDKSLETIGSAFVISISITRYKIHNCK